MYKMPAEGLGVWAQTLASVINGSGLWDNWVAGPAGPIVEHMVRTELRL